MAPNEKTVEQYLLRDGQFKLNAVYTRHPDYVLEAMTADERAEAAAFQCSLYEDFTIYLDDIFYRT